MLVRDKHRINVSARKPCAQQALLQLTRAKAAIHQQPVGVATLATFYDGGVARAATTQVAKTQGFASYFRSSARILRILLAFSLPSGAPAALSTETTLILPSLRTTIRYCSGGVAGFAVLKILPKKLRSF